MAKAQSLSKHHYWWPKWKFKDSTHRSVHKWIRKGIHAAYHHHFLKNCREVNKRTCWNSYCRFWKICCYHKSHDTF